MLARNDIFTIQFKDIDLRTLKKTIFKYFKTWEKMKKFNVFMVFVTLMAALLSKKTEAKSLGDTKVYKMDRISGDCEEVNVKILSDRFPSLSDDQIQHIAQQAIQISEKSNSLVQIKTVGIDWEFKTVVSGLTISTSKLSEGQAYLSPVLNRQIICISDDSTTLKCETLEDQENKFTYLYKFTDNGAKMSLEVSSSAIGKSCTEYYHLL